MVRVKVRLPKTLRKRLDREAHLEGRSCAAVFRSAVALYLATRETRPARKRK